MILALATAALADPTWVSFDKTASDGTTPDVKVLESSVAGTTIDFQIYGMWEEDLKVGEDIYQRLSVPGTSHTSEAGKPMLPIINKLIAIPATAGVKFEITYKKDEVLKDYIVYPAQIPATDSGFVSEFVIDKNFYQMDTQYPVKISEVDAPGIMNEVRVVKLTINPFRYNPKTRELTVATEITIHLDFSGYDGRNILMEQSTQFSPQWDRLYRNLILNYDNLYNSTSINTLSTTYFYDCLLVIYADDFRPEVNTSLQNYITWKRCVGYIVDTINLTRVPNINGQPDDAQDLKTYIQSWYSGISYPGPVSRYVLLIGDAPIYNTAYPENNQGRYDAVQTADPSHIPTYAGYTYIDYSQTGNPVNGRIYSDYFYQLVAGNDNYPDLCIGRWCPQSQSGQPDLTTYTTKVLQYEATPDPQWNCSKALLVSNKYYYSSDPLAYYRNKDSVDRYTTPWPSSYVRVPIHGKDAGSTNQALIDNINSDGGLGIINYRGHGGWGSWIEWSYLYESFDTLMIRNDLTNTDYYPVVYNVSCSNGCIPGTIVGSNTPSEVLVEAWTRTPDAGAVAALGASRASWSEENSVLDTAIFENHFGQNMNCGMAINAGKAAMITDGPSTTLGLANAQMYYWIGDPTLDVWHYQPQSAQCTYAISLDGTTLLVYVWINYTTLVPNAKVCLHRDLPALHYVAYTNASGYASFPNPTNSSDIMVTATNQVGSPCIRPVSVLLGSAPSSKVGLDENLPEMLDWQLNTVTPNPSRSSVVISFIVGGISGSKETEHLELSIYDVSGRMVRELTSEDRVVGLHDVTWNGCDDHGRRMPVGVYFVRLSSNKFHASKQIVLIK